MLKYANYIIYIYVCIFYKNKRAYRVRIPVGLPASELAENPTLLFSFRFFALSQRLDRLNVLMNLYAKRYNLYIVRAVYESKKNQVNQIPNLS